MSRPKIVYKHCETPGCCGAGKLTRYKGKYVCSRCVNPPDPEQSATDYLFQRVDAYTPENMPMPGLKVNDIIGIQRKLGLRKPLFATKRYH